MIARSTEWARAHPEAHRAQVHRWSKKNPARHKMFRREGRFRHREVIAYAKKAGISRPEARRILSELDARQQWPQEKVDQFLARLVCSIFE